MIGVRYLVSSILGVHRNIVYHIFLETLVAHRAHKLLGGLNNALAFGFFEVEPDKESLKVCVIAHSLPPH